MKQSFHLCLNIYNNNVLTIFLKMLLGGTDAVVFGLCLYVGATALIKEFRDFPFVVLSI